ncbi:MAG: arsenate reductase ArsC [Candidatus Margulisiibacteriota bacterium]
MPQRILFVCVHNSARSQMAEAFLNTLDEGRFEAESAGLEPGNLNPLVVTAMNDVGIDISSNKTKTVKSKMNKRYDYVVTVCDEASGERCPTFPGKTRRLHWSFTDPSSFTGSDEEKYAKIIEVRDAILARVREFMEIPDFP